MRLGKSDEGGAFWSKNQMP